MEKKELIDKLEEQRATLLFDICENERIFHRDIIFQLVSELRAVSKLIMLLKKTEE